LEGDAFPFRLNHLLPEHQAWEIDDPPVGRRIGAVVIAELTLVTFVSYHPQIPRSKLVGLAVHLFIIEAPKERVERRAKWIAPPTAVTDIEDPAQLLIQSRLTPELLRCQVETHVGVSLLTIYIPRKTAPLSPRRSRPGESKRRLEQMVLPQPPATSGSL
jgi:hypothetical protein